MFPIKQLRRVLSGLLATSALLACGSGAGPDSPASGGAGGSGDGGSPSPGNMSGGAGTPVSQAGTGAAPSGSTGGSGGVTASGGASGTSGASSLGGSGAAPSNEPFSFFVASVKALQRLSNNQQGFGGDLRFGETGAGAGLRGADKICSSIAETSMPGNGKTWRAFLSVTQDEQGEVVNAIDRVGTGPWYDRLGRLVAANKADLAQPRPAGADSAIVNDLPNEDGVPNRDPDGTGDVDNHDTLTGSGATGQLFMNDPAVTCNDWTSSESAGAPRVGHSWPRTAGPSMGGPTGSGGRSGGGPGGLNGSGENWMSALTEAGCAPGVFLIEAGPPGKNGTKSVGDGGGYGGIYCFALTP